MTLVDTSVWIDHLRHADSSLISMLAGGLVIAHPFVIGELALGNLKQRDVILDALNSYPVQKSPQTTKYCRLSVKISYMVWV